MRRLFSLLAAICLFAALTNGALLHAAEVAEGGEVTATTEWLHSDGDLDHVPADGDKNYPHHHSVCHGHDLAAPMKACGTPAASRRDVSPFAAPDLMLVASPPAIALRPPIL